MKPLVMRFSSITLLLPLSLSLSLLRRNILLSTCYVTPSIYVLSYVNYFVHVTNCCTLLGKKIMSINVFDLISYYTLIIDFNWLLVSNVCSEPHRFTASHA